MTIIKNEHGIIIETVFNFLARLDSRKLCSSKPISSSSSSSSSSSNCRNQQCHVYDVCITLCVFSDGVRGLRQPAGRVHLLLSLRPQRDRPFRVEVGRVENPVVHHQHVRHHRRRRRQRLRQKYEAAARMRRRSAVAGEGHPALTTHVDVAYAVVAIALRLPFDSRGVARSRNMGWTTGRASKGV